MPSPSTVHALAQKHLAQRRLRQQEHFKSVNDAAVAQLHLAMSGDVTPAATNKNPLSLTEVRASLESVVTTTSKPSKPLEHKPAPLPKRGHREVTSLAEVDQMEQRLKELHEKLDSASTVESLDSIGEGLKSIRNSISRPSSIPEVASRRQRLQAQMEAIDNKVTVLYAAAPEPTGPMVFDANELFDTKAFDWSAAAQVIAFIGFIGHCFTFLGVSACNLFMQLAELAVRATFSIYAEPDQAFSSDQKHFLDQIPKTLHVALKLFSLDSTTTVYALCPECKFSHAPLKNGSGIQRWPAKCQRQLLDGGGTCGASLLTRRRFGLRPTVPYLVPSFAEYLARLLSDPQVEKACCDIIDEAREQGQEPNSSMATVFDATFARTFKGPDGGPFVDRKDKIRLLFSLNHDHFPPRGGGKRTHSNHSLGVFALAPLNLDPSTRYQPENMYITVLPGPRGARGDELNYGLAPIVDQLEVAWNRGIRLSCTGLHPEGAVVECGIACCVCDLVAARHIAGFAGHNSHWICTCCALNGRDKVWETDPKHWPIRDVDKMRQYAYSYRNASTEADKAHIFDTYGIRWSELWRLPYWNPMQQLVVDAMHNLLEGLVHVYCRYILGLSSDQINKQASQTHAFDYFFEPYNHDHCPEELKINQPKERKQIAKVQDLLLLPITDTFSVDTLRKRLMALNNPALRFVVHTLERDGLKNGDENGIKLGKAMFKAEFVELLISWRRKQPLKAIDSQEPIVTQELLTHIQNVIRNTVRPSWLPPVPFNFGEKQAGSPKADQWRLLSTLYLPIALITFWGDDDGAAPADSYLLSVLDHAMLLFQAVSIAMRYNMTTKLAETYRQLITAWIDGLRDLFPKLRQQVHTRTNFHMALHIYDFLLRFGPIVNWWCFPFERLNGKLQKLTTNERVGGQMEAAMVKSWLRAGNLRRWLKHPRCPPALAQLRSLYAKAFPSTDLLNVEPSSSSFASDKAYYAVTSYLGRVFYSRWRTHLGNSVVLYHPPDAPTALVAGQIEHIEHSEDDVEPVFYVRRHLPLPPGLYDPFSRYKFFQAWSFSSDLAPRAEQVPFQHVVGHGIRYGYSRNRSVVVNVSRA